MYIVDEFLVRRHLASMRASTQKDNKKDKCRHEMSVRFFFNIMATMKIHSVTVWNNFQTLSPSIGENFLITILFKGKQLAYPDVLTVQFSQCRGH